MTNFVDSQDVDAKTFYNAYKYRTILISIGFLMILLALRIHSLISTQKLNILDIIFWVMAFGFPIILYFLSTRVLFKEQFMKLEQIKKVFFELDETLLKIQVKSDKISEKVLNFPLERIKTVKMKLNLMAIPALPYFEKYREEVETGYFRSYNYVIRPSKKVEIRGTNFIIQLTPTDNHDFIYQLHEHLIKVKNPSLVEAFYNLENKIESIKVHES